MLALIALCTTLLIDTAKSAAQFTVQHVFVETVTGSVPIASGEVEVRSGSPVPASVRATLDATKIKTGDDDRDGVLQTSDWFDTKQYPQWTFVSTKIVPESPNSFAMDGTLTIRGVSHPQHLDVQVSGDPSHPFYRAVGKVDRKIWGMAVTRLDPAIGNPVDVRLDIVTK
jgi:polyisoprenoid-binding protein YceI